MNVENISHLGQTLCLIIRSDPEPSSTEFYTPNDFNLQVGKVVYRGNSEIARHTHRPVTRTVIGTSEVIVVQKGSVILDIYTDDRKFLESRNIGKGDIVVLVSGGHGFRVLEDAVLAEIKQGPYSGVQEKDRF